MTNEELIRYGNDYYRDLVNACCGVEEKHKEFVRESIKALEQQPCERFEWGIDGKVYKITKAKDGKEICQQVCDDAISREAVNTLVDELARAISDERCYIPQRGRDTGHIMHDILDLPSVTPQQKYGKWICKEITDDYRVTGQCSECKERRIIDNFCPNCGTKMVEPQESEEV